MTGNNISMITIKHTTGIQGEIKVELLSIVLSLVARSSEENPSWVFSKDSISKPAL